ncbi:MAG: DUF2884 family protein [Pseudomonadota bacterium]
MKTLLASAIILTTSTLANANDTSVDLDSCEVDFNAGMKIHNEVLSFTSGGKTIYTIINDDKLFIDDKEIDLSRSQKKIVSSYSQNVRDVVPEVKSIVIDAVDLAIGGINLAFSGLLGENSEVATNLTEELQTIKEEVDIRFDENNFEISENGGVLPDVFGEEIEQRIESLVEETVQNSMGYLLIALGKQMVASDSEQSFEERMETFAQQIEQDMEARGELIEMRADQICDALIEIDALEEEMKATIDEMPSLDVIYANNKGEYTYNF